MWKYWKYHRSTPEVPLKYRGSTGNNTKVMGKYWKLEKQIEKNTKLKTKKDVKKDIKEKNAKDKKEDEDFILLIHIIRN